LWQESGATIAIIATGALIHKALVAAKELGNEGIKTTVVNLSTIKPLDTATILAVAKHHRAIVTVEEHQIMGGMGSAVAELLAETNPLPMRFVGVRDLFGQSGQTEELLEHYGMGVKDIKKAVAGLSRI
jgi:transketolase